MSLPMNHLSTIMIDPRPYYGFSLLALLAVLSLAAQWVELTAGLSPYRTGWALSTAMRGVDWCKTTKGRMFEAWMEPPTGFYLNRAVFGRECCRLRAT